VTYRVVQWTTGSEITTDGGVRCNSTEI